MFVLNASLNEGSWFVNYSNLQGSNSIILAFLTVDPLAILYILSYTCCVILLCNINYKVRCLWIDWSRTLFNFYCKKKFRATQFKSHWVTHEFWFGLEEYCFLIREDHDLRLIILSWHTWNVTIIRKVTIIVHNPPTKLLYDS